MEPIILASSSPRRQEILKMLNIPFQVMMPNIDERLYAHEAGVENFSEVLAVKKINMIKSQLSARREIPWILGCDTSIELDGKIFGKPESHGQAADFMRALQGRTHNVRTSIALYNGKRRAVSTRTATTRVTFVHMTDAEIEWYVNTGEWHGAAGGYRIQSLAQCFVSKIDGSQSCVAGLPIFDLFVILKEQGYSIIG